MRDKFRQVNEFLKLLEHTGALEGIAHTPVRLVDCGCGSAYLTLAAYHYLNDVRGMPATLDGVDVDAQLIAKSRAQVQAMGLDARVCFYRSAIIDYEPDAPPDIVLALHACDTATDEALAQGIKWGARLILAVPCCHHHLHRQLERAPPFAPVLREGILKKRLADILTDTFRGWRCASWATAPTWSSSCRPSTPTAT
ncbi:MAG: SAM-dependent methyltransferase [Anaerolineae bacterium]|nr:SAM-dependent methyltransferase [Anaerolineae bacterium]